MSDAMTASTAPPEGSFLGTVRGKVTLALLCAVTFLDVVDGSIGPYHRRAGRLGGADGRVRGQ